MLKIIKENVRFIYLAAKHGNRGILHYLVNCRCDVAAKDKLGKTPMDYSRRNDIKTFFNHKIYGTPYVSEAVQVTVGIFRGEFVIL